jgi:hypothetical protein
MWNNTPIYTAVAVDITPFTDGCMVEGRVTLHDACVDKPTPITPDGNYTCEVRAGVTGWYHPVKHLDT